MPEYVILGGSAGAIGAVDAIRKVDPAGSLTVVAEEPSPTYSRPMIGDYLSGEATLGKMTYRNDDFWTANRVQYLTGRKATSIDFSKKYVELDQGGRVSFEKLLIATGSKPFIPKMDGTNRNGVFTFITLTDAEDAKTGIKEAEKAVVLGGGLIGVCVAEALSKKDVKVTIVELQDRILGALLDTPASDIVADAMKSKGVEAVTGRTVKKIAGRDGDDCVGAVVLDNGESIRCDKVVIAAGVIPRTELVQGTDIRVNKGIVVDRFMRTSIPDVYACGDVSEAYDFVFDDNRVLPQWPTAYLGGKVAGYNMAGQRTEYPGGTTMSALKYFDTPVIAVGRTNQNEGAGYEVLTFHDRERAVYKKVVLRTGLIHGFILVNDIERAGVLFHLMRNAVDVGGFKERLLSEDLGLADLPEVLRREMLAGELA